MVIWVIGLSGSGKTTFANELHKSLNNEKNFIKIDGDVIRDLFQNDLGYEYQDRRKNANRIMKLSQFLANNGINVICSILSISQEDRIWNRENIPNYFKKFAIHFRIQKFHQPFNFILFQLLHERINGVRISFEFLSRLQTYLTAFRPCDQFSWLFFNAFQNIHLA